MTPPPPDTLSFHKAPDALLPAVIVHARSGKVLMLGYMNQDAYHQTLETGQVTFFSRSRQRLWVKGETSGHYLQFMSAQADCDSDALLIQALPQGPTCHTGTESCFDAPGANTASKGYGWLGQLEALVAHRRRNPQAGSYVNKLQQAGTPRMAQKVGEEGLEVALAAVQGHQDETAAEAADLLFHLLVLLESQGLSLDHAVQVLWQRHPQPPGSATAEPSTVG